MSKTNGSHYKASSGHDLIAHWCIVHKPPIARAKITSQIERYCSRYGEKDDPIIEARKILDYAKRLVDYEEGLLK